jgi:hypothetical protein
MMSSNHRLPASVSTTEGRAKPTIRAWGSPSRKARSAGVAITKSPTQLGQKTMSFTGTDPQVLGDIMPPDCFV